MDKRDFSLYNFNEDLKQKLIGQPLDFGAKIAGSYECNVSVTAQYDPPTGDKRYITLDKDLTCIDAVDPEGFYYGTSPKLDDDLIIDAISHLRFSSIDGLDSFISEHCSLFMLHADQAEYLLDLARYIILSVASNFGIRLKIPMDLKNSIVEQLTLYDEHHMITQWKDGYLIIFGCPTESIISVFTDITFMRNEDGIWQVSDNGIHLKDIYEDPRNITLLFSKVFYSGVLIKPVRIEKLVDRYENDGVASYVIHFERSTFATVFALDRNYTKHPLLIDNNNKIVEYLKRDDKAKAKLIDSIDNNRSSSDLLPEINEYLLNSFNANQIAVSANIICEDNILILGHRPENTIDNGSLYPSVNGNAELIDKDVRIYKESAYEDYPTISLEHIRMDFLGEISREAYAEMQIDLPKQEWHCHGIFVAGNRPQTPIDASTYDSPSRRLHFNIIFEQQLNCSFDSLYSSSKKATESFENDNLIGLRIECNKNKAQMIGHNILKLINLISEQNDVVEAIFFLVLFVTMWVAKGIFENTVSDIITLVLSFIIVLCAAVHIAKIISRAKFRRKHISKVKLFDTLSRQDRDNRIHKIIEGYSIHPAAYASLKSYIDYKLYSRIFPPK